MTPYNLPSTGGQQQQQHAPAKNLIAQINEQQEAVEPPVKAESTDKPGTLDCIEVWYVSLMPLFFFSSSSYVTVSLTASQEQDTEMRQGADGRIRP